jgi:hypothetical protein
MDEDKIKRLAAEAFCRYRGIDPVALEPGDAYGIDGYMRNGDPAHFIWREYANHRAVDELVYALKQMISPAKVTADEMKAVRLSSFQRDVLQHLFEDEKREYYSSLNNIAINLQCEKNRVRLACRSLKRKGLAKQVPFHDDEGFIRGSGYGITPAGIAYAENQGWKGGEE